MALTSWLRDKYTLYCPNCSNELNWFETAYGTGIRIDYLRCVVCDMFFIKDAALTPTDAPGKRVEHFKKQGWDDEGYQGVPTSYFYKPGWISKIERLLGLN
ncbi:hypothetical protein GCM10020370_39320 [Paenibacillus hodogayensis]